MAVYQDQKLLIVLIREVFIRPNPVLGFKSRTGFKEWLASLLKEIVQVKNYCYDPSAVEYFVRFLAVNQGNHASRYFIPHYRAYEERGYQALYRALLNSRGTGRQYASDCGGWVWTLIRTLPPEVFYDRSELDRRFEEAVRAVLTVLALHGVSFFQEEWEVYPLLSLSRKILELFDEHKDASPHEPACQYCSY